MLAQQFRDGLHNHASRLSVQEVPALEQQFPPPDQEQAAPGVMCRLSGTHGEIGVRGCWKPLWYLRLGGLLLTILEFDYRSAKV
jgi:hypothetical protein